MSLPARSHFDGKSVVITGASSGLGASLAEAMAAAGGKVVLFARSREDLEVVAARCRSVGADPLVVVGDVTVARDCERLVVESVERFGGIEILIACAGIGMWARFDEIEDPDILKRVMDVNYGGLVNVTFYGLPHLKQSRGMLVAISSVQGKIGVPYHSGYAASKHAVQGFCDSLRMELEGTGVAVLTVLAHWIRGTQLRARALGEDGVARGGRAPSHGSGAVPVEEMSRAVMSAMEKRKREVFVPSWMRLLSWLSAVAPSLADRLVSHRVNREGARQREGVK